MICGPDDDDLSPEDEEWCRQYLGRWADTIDLDDDEDDPA